MIRCGALRSIDTREPVLLFKSQAYFNSKCNKVKTEYLTQDLHLPEYSKKQRVVSELELLGFGVSEHPLYLYRDVVPWHKMVASPDLEKHNGKRIKFTGWYVTNRIHKTDTGETMLFLTLEDMHGFCDVVFFPKIFEKYHDTIRGHGPFTVTGKLQSRLKEEANLIVEKVEAWPHPVVLAQEKLDSEHARLEKAYRTINYFER